MITIDASRYGNTPNRTGVENYSFHLINALVKLAPGKITLVSPRPVPLDVPQLIIPLPRLWTQGRLSWEVWRNSELRASTLFIPSHQMPVIHPAKTVITIHDVVFRRFPACYSLASQIYLDWGARFACKSAQKIIVPSETTRDDLIHFYHADPNKIVVIPHGYTRVTLSEAKSLPVTSNLGDSSPRKCGVQSDTGKYFLFLGRIEAKKNLLTLIKAFNQFHQTHPDWRLIMAGKPGIGGAEITEAAKKNPAITFPGYVDEAKKTELLKNAAAFVFPSLYEGFGFPLLEAMDYNLPIIASDIPSSREVAGNTALYFDPASPDELTQQMERLLTHPPDTAGFTQILARHTWDECAKKTLTVLSQN